jgi:hypothetical protein
MAYSRAEKPKDAFIWLGRYLNRGAETLTSEAVADRRECESLTSPGAKETTRNVGLFQHLLLNHFAVCLFVGILAVCVTLTVAPITW